MEKLPREYYELFEKAGAKKKLSAGQMVFLQGDEISSVYLIVSGRIRMFYVGNNGKEITYRIIGEGQLIGEAAFLSHLQPSSVLAVTDTTLIVCPVNSLYPLIKTHDELTRMIFELLTENYTELCRGIRRLTIHNSAQRIASYLVDLTEYDDESLGIVDHTLPYTQEELSVCLDLHRTTVARVLSRFSKEGFIRLGYKRIKVLDCEALKRVVIPS